MKLTEKEKIHKIIDQLIEVAEQYENQANTIGHETQHKIEMGWYFRGVSVGIDIALNKLQRTRF